MTKSNNEMINRWTQATLYGGTQVISECTLTNIAPSGNPLIPRKEGGDICKQIFQNIRGTRDNNFGATHKIKSIDKLGTNMTGFQETNKPWT